MSFALVFSGQGSQSVAMMQGFQHVAPVRDTFAEASELLSQDLWRLVAEGPEDELSQTVNTQPVMLVAGVAVYRAWRAIGGPAPTVAAGHSLGEYSALVVAGSLAFQDAVPLVRLRAESMQHAVPFGEGAIAAILGLDDALVRLACQESAQGEVLEAANYNSPGQVVIAGSRSAVLRGIENAKEKGAKRAVLLPMSAPSHCALMHPAAAQLRAVLETVALREPAFPVLHNADVASYSNPAQIKDALVRQLYSPVRWVETIQAIARGGIMRIVECGPGKILSGLNRRIDARLRSLALVDSAALREACVELSAVATQ